MCGGLFEILQTEEQEKKVFKCNSVLKKKSVLKLSTVVQYRVK